MVFRLTSITVAVAMLGVGLASHSSMAAPSDSHLLKQYDTDGDKTLDLNEVKAAATAHFQKLDKDADGTLSPAEAKGALRKMTFKSADADNDGTVSKDEYMALVEKRFAKADADNDGSLSHKELRSKAGQRLKSLID